MTRNTDRGPTTDDAINDADMRWSQVAQRHFEPNGTAELTTDIIYAIAEADGVDPRTVKSLPLYEVVDVPAIEAAFFGSNVNSKPRQGVGSVEFQYADYLVTVQSDGWIQVHEPAEAEQQ